MRLSVVFSVRLPEVPVMVTAVCPVAAVALAVNMSVLVVAVLAGLNAAVTPLGRPDADKLTAPLKPPVGVTVIAVVLFPLCATLIGLGAAPSVNPDVTGPDRLTASTTTSRSFGKVRLCTDLLVLSAKE